MIKLRHIFHPIRSIKSLYRKISLSINNHIVTKKLSKICREYRDRCWCGGQLSPFKWHSSYGVCDNCGCYVNMYPPIDGKKIYSSKLYWHMMRKYYGYPSIEASIDVYKKDGRLTYWLQLIQRYVSTKGTVIEVGCAPGVLLADLQVMGYKCIGVEPDIKTANWIRQRMKVDVKAGLFPGIELPDCELFLAFDVLEHSPKPHEFIQEIARLLKPGGIAIIQTPIDRYNYDLPFGEKFEQAFKEFEHLFLFNNKAIKLLVESPGLEIITLDERLWLHHEICIFRKPLIVQ